MTNKKFLGKIHEDPWVALARGSREVMASLWQDYLGEILGAPFKSSRFKVLRREIEKAAGYQKIYQDWNTLTPEARAQAWRGLTAVARQRAEAARESCVRCGECCERGSPTLLTSDLGLFHREVLTWSEVYTLRAGEQVTSREGRVTTLKEERLKIREVPGSRQCWFYLAATRACRIYEDRPEQCRRQNCWGEPALPPAPPELLNRRELLGGVPQVWDLISAHQQRCDYGLVVRALSDLGAGQAEAGDALFEALHFDHYLRQLLMSDWGLTEAATELLLGRPLNKFLADYGLHATLTPEGVFQIERREPYD